MVEPLQIRWKVDGKEVAEIDRIFEVTRLAAGRTDDLYRRILPPIRDDIHSHFATESGPSGSWARLSPVYAAWKAANFPGEPLLQLRHILFLAATQTGASGNITVVNKQSLEFGVDLNKVPYARVHDFGGRAGRGSRMPKREYMFLSTKGQDEAAQTAARFLWDEGLAGRPGAAVAGGTVSWGGLVGLRSFGGLT